MRYEITGGNLPVVICYLQSGEGMITESGSMSWMSPNMKMETVGGGMKKMLGRAFFAAEEGVELSVYMQKKLGKGLFGGEGFIMQKLTGQGTAFIEIDGYGVEYNLAPGQEMIVDTGYLAAMEETCTMDIVKVEGMKNMFLGGEGLFNTVVRGPGKIILQTMPIANVAALLQPFFADGKK